MKDTTRTWEYVELHREEAEKFKAFLDENGIKKYPQECYNLISVGALVNSEEHEMCKEFLATL